MDFRWYIHQSEIPKPQVKRSTKSSQYICMKKRKNENRFVRQLHEKNLFKKKFIPKSRRVYG